MAVNALSIQTSVGEALRFVRENWRFVLSVAAVGALAQTSLFIFSPIPLLLLFGMIGSSVVIYAALTRAALSGVGEVRARLVADSRNAGGAGVIVGFFFALVAFMAAVGAMAVLIAPYAEQAQAAKDDDAALRQLMERAISEQPDAIFLSGLVGFVLLLLVTSFSYAAIPASVERGRVVVFESWKWTGRAVLRIAGARVLLLGLALIFAGALQSLVGLSMGLGVRDPIALAQSAQASPVAFLVFVAVAQFLQIAVYTALEAGLSASIYKALKPETTGVAAPSPC